MSQRSDRLVAALAACFTLIFAAPALAQGAARSYPLPFPFFANAPDDQDLDEPDQPLIEPGRPMVAPQPRAMIPQEPAIAPEPQAIPQDEATSDAAVSPQFRRQIVGYASREAPGTIVVDTPNAYLYYVLGNGRAIRYGIGVGREGFTWSGVRSIGRKEEWPDWHPPVEMIARQPYLPRFMAGGPGNPLGARAMYLQGTLYRIHGTSEPNTIGKHVSSGCIRMLNADAIDLYNRTHIGTKVVVLPDYAHRAHRDDVRHPQQHSAIPAARSLAATQPLSLRPSHID